MLYIKYIKVQKSYLSCKFNKLKENKYILSLALSRAVLSTRLSARLSAVKGETQRGTIEYILSNFWEYFDKIIKNLQ